MRRLILNADDYAMDEGVDRAILTLIGQGVVTAASAMVLSPRWEKAAGQLAPENADCGLHLDLTSAFAASRLALPDLSGIITRSYSGRLDIPAISDVIETQLDLFEHALRRPPDFVDGHQHVHQLPGIRSQLFDALRRRYGAEASSIGIRVCTARRWSGAKAATIGALGAAATARLARQFGHPVNTDFVGVYGFSPDAKLPVLWRGWLANLRGDAPLAMCHVAAASGQAAAGDPIRRAREAEFGWLASSAFRELCAELSVSLERWPRGGGRSG